MYIEINLLPREFRPKKSLIRIDFRFLLMLLIVLGALGLVGYYIFIQRSVQNVKKQHEFMLVTERKMQSIITLNNEVENIKKDIEERVNIIKELTSESDLRFMMLEYINVMLSDNLWLSGINESNRGGIISFSIEGMSYSKENISSFLASLEKFKHFSSVLLESITPSPLAVRDAFNFIIMVELASYQPPTEEK